MRLGDLPVIADLSKSPRLCVIAVALRSKSIGFWRVGAWRGIKLVNRGTFSRKEWHLPAPDADADTTLDEDMDAAMEEEDPWDLWHGLEQEEEDSRLRDLEGAPLGVDEEFGDADGDDGGLDAGERGYGDDVGDYNDDGGGDDCDGNGVECWHVSDRPDDDGDE